MAVIQRVGLPAKPRKWMSVHEMGDMLGLKKTDRYWLVHKNYFRTETLLGKIINTGNFYNAVVKDGIVGYINIPAIDVNLPIYDNTKDETLELGAGLLEKSSLPTGKNGTHSVITGHSGLTMSKMFSDLPELTTEDCFYIYFLDEKIKYQIYSIETVKPSEVTNHLSYNRSEGYCTLMTCTPIGVNTHRLLVHGKRVEESENESVNAKSTSQSNSSSTKTTSNIIKKKRL